MKGRGNFVQKNISLIENKKQELIDAIKAILKEAEELGISKSEILKDLES